MTRSLARATHRLLENLFRLLGLAEAAALPVPARAVRAGRGVSGGWAPAESLEQRTLMSIVALNSAVQQASGLFEADMPRIAANAAGNYVVVWSTGGSGGGGLGNDGTLHFALFNSSDQTLVSDTIVATTLSRGVPAGASATPVITTLDHPTYAVAMNPAGSFVIAWEDDSDVMAQLYDAIGSNVGSPINVSQGAAVNQTTPGIAMDSAGDFAVTWLADQDVTVTTKTMTPKSYADYLDSDTNVVKRNTTNATTDSATASFTTSTVMVRRFDSTGSGGAAITVSPPAVVASGTAPSSSFTTNLNPGIAMDAAGDFAVVWDASGYAPAKTLGTPANKYSNPAYFYDSNYVKHTVTLHYYTGPQFYYDMGFTGSRMMVQRYSAAGSASGAAVTALVRGNSSTAGNLVAIDASIAMDTAGDFVVSEAAQYAKSKTTGTGDYATTTYASSASLSIKRFAASGAAGPEIKVASVALTPFFSSTPNEVPLIANADIAMDPSGNMLAIWDQAAYDSGTQAIVSTGVFARRYNAAGAAQEAAPFQIDIGAVSRGVFPDVAFSGGNINLAYNDGAEQLDTQRFRPLLPASTLGFSTEPVDSNAGALPEIDVQILDANGYLNTTSTSAVTLSIFSGTTGAKLTGGLTVSAVGGIAHFTNVSLTRGGNYVLKASGSSLTTATSSSFTITTVPTHLVFTTTPKTATAGAIPTIIVSVEDINNDVSVTDGSTITLSAGTNSLVGSVTAIANHGVATFSSFFFANSGTYSLTATDGALAAGASPTITVNPSSTVNFTFTPPPANAIAGAKFTLKVTASDIFSNISKNDHTKITLTLNGVPGAKIYGPTSAPLVNGVATFSGISIATAGTYTVSVAGGVASTTSSSFTITAAAAAKLVYASQPTVTVAGQIVSNIVVNVVDKFGNRVLTNSSAVTMTVLSAPKGATAPTGTLVQNASSGQATFGDLVFTSEGPYKLKVTQGKLSATSAGFTVQPDAPAKLVFIKNPNSVTAGTNEGTITVAVEDQFNNIETASSAIVTLSLNGAGKSPTLLGNLTASAFKGIATFNSIGLRTAGTYTLAAASAGLTNGTSNSFIISPAKGKTLQFLTQPTDVASGQTMSSPIAVQLIDAFGNLATTDTSKVSLKIKTGPIGALAPTNATASAIAGVATFANFTLQTTGSYTLTASDGLLTAATSNSFSVL